MGNFSVKFFHACHAYLYSDIPLSVGVTLAEDHKINRQQKLLAYTFQLSRINFGVELKQFKLNILILVWSESRGIRGNNCDLLTEKTSCWYVLRYLLACLVQLGMMLDVTESHILTLVEVIMTLI